MKKALSLILALVLCLSLVACGEKTPKADPAEAIVGEWSGTYIWQGVKLTSNGAELNTGDTVDFTMSVFKGGAIEIIRENPENEYKTTSTGKWEVSDGVLVITCATSGGDIVISWEINTDASSNTLSMNGSNHAFPQTLTKEN